MTDYFIPYCFNVIIFECNFYKYKFLVEMRVPEKQNNQIVTFSTHQTHSQWVI